MKKYLLCILFSVLCISFTNVVYAADLFDDVEVFYTNTEESAHNKVSLKFNNPSFDGSKTYYLVYSETNLALNSIISQNDLINNYGVENFVSIDVASATANGLEKIFARNKEAFDFYVLEALEYTLENGSRNQVVSNAITIDRDTSLNQYALGQRIIMYFDANHIAPYLYDVHPTGIDRNIKYKIGIVTDNSILNSIKNEESDALEKLLNYAKNDSNGITQSINTSNYQNTISVSDTVDINAGVYYYAYYYTDDEYYPVYDIDLHQGYVSSNGEKSLLNYRRDGFTWNIDTEQTVENPKTGITNIGIGLIVVFIVTSVTYLKMKKYSKFPLK